MPETSLCRDGQSSVDKASDFAPRLLFSEDFCQNNCVHRKFSTASVSAASMAMLCLGEFEGSQLCRLSQVRFLVGVSHCRRVDHRNCTTEFLQLGELFNRACFFVLCASFSGSHMIMRTFFCSFVLLLFQFFFRQADQVCRPTHLLGIGAAVST